MYPVPTISPIVGEIPLCPDDQGWKTKILPIPTIDIVWMTRSPASQALLELVSCHCSAGCDTRRCSCFDGSMSCTPACHCNQCKNPQNPQHHHDLDNDEECEMPDDEDSSSDHDISSNDEDWIESSVWLQTVVSISVDSSSALCAILFGPWSRQVAITSCWWSLSCYKCLYE